MCVDVRVCVRVCGVCACVYVCARYGRDSIDVAWRTATEYAERTKVQQMLNRTAAKVCAVRECVCTGI